jgi:hypothetical protein
MSPLRVSAGFGPAPIRHLSGTNPQVSDTHNPHLANPAVVLT